MNYAHQATHNTIKTRRRLGLIGSALLMAIGSLAGLLYLLSPTAVGLAAPSATLQLAPPKVSLQGTFYVSGCGFSPEETVDINWDNPTMTLATSEPVAGDGCFEMVVSFPDPHEFVSATGVHTVTAVGNSSAIEASGSLDQVTPQLVTAPFGPPDAIFSVSGCGWGELINEWGDDQLYLYRRPIFSKPATWELLVNVSLQNVADDYCFEEYLLMPEEGGFYELLATMDSSLVEDWASSGTVVQLLEPDLTFYPSEAATSGQTTAVSCGWFQGESVEFTWLSTDLYLGAATAGSDSCATLSFFVPGNATFGQHSVEASGQQSGKSLDKQMTVRNRELIFSPSYLPQSALAIATGCGWSGDETVRIDWLRDDSGFPQFFDVNVDAFGCLQGANQIPDEPLLLFGPMVVTGTGQTTGAQASGTLTITHEGTAAFGDLFGLVGESTPLVLSNWPAGSDLLSLHWDAPDGTETRFEVISVDSSGMLTLGVDVPAVLPPLAYVDVLIEGEGFSETLSLYIGDNAQIEVESPTDVDGQLNMTGSGWGGGTAITLSIYHHYLAEIDVFHTLTTFAHSEEAWDDLYIGNYTLNANGSDGRSATSTFTIENNAALVTDRIPTRCDPHMHVGGTGFASNVNISFKLESGDGTPLQSLVQRKYSRTNFNLLFSDIGTLFEPNNSYQIRALAQSGHEAVTASFLYTEELQVVSLNHPDQVVNGDGFYSISGFCPYESTDLYLNRIHTDTRLAGLTMDSTGQRAGGRLTFSETLAEGAHTLIAIGEDGSVATYPFTIVPKPPIQVEDEYGVPVVGAQVYHKGVLLGETDGLGQVDATAVQKGDLLFARKQVDTRRNDYSGYYARVYITSLSRVNGELHPSTAGDVFFEQRLILRPVQTQIGFELDVSIEWNASISYTNELSEAFRSASDLLYDASDGQLFFERVNISDNKAGWSTTDMRVHASNVEWPHARLAGIQEEDGWIMVGRNNGTCSLDKVDHRCPRPISPTLWTTDNSIGTLVHEFGHYGLNIFDSYIGYDADDEEYKVKCTSVISGTPSSDVAATLMAHHWYATEFAMRGVAGLWSNECTTAHHFQERGVSDWETILVEYQDDENDWRLVAPLAPAAGPTAVPAPSMTRVTVNNANDSNVCPAIPVIARDRRQRPAAYVQVYLNKLSGQRLYQGLTDQNGLIEIIGAESGDSWALTTRVAGGVLLFNQAALNCNTRALDAALTYATLDPVPLTVETVVEPIRADQARFQISVDRSLLAIMMASLIVDDGDGSDETIPLTLAPTESGYEVIYRLPDDVADRRGLLVLAIETVNGESFELVRPYQIDTLDVGRVPFGSGSFELERLAGDVSLVAISQVQADALPPTDYRFVGDAYRVAEYATSRARSRYRVAFYVATDQDDSDFGEALVVQRIDGEWVMLATSVDLEHGRVSAVGDGSGDFAIVVPDDSVDSYQIYLPLALKP